MSCVIGLTGGIGTGKSTVAAILAELGAVVIDADAIVHECQRPGGAVHRAIVEEFGEEVVDPASGELDRKALAARVFDDSAARERLTAIVHPPVIAEMARRLQEAQESGAKLVVLDIPLLLEGRKTGTGSGARMPFDAVVLAYTPEEVQIERSMARDGSSREEVLERMRAQLPIEEKRAMADHVIDNSGSREETERQVRALYARLTAEPGSARPPSAGAP